MGKFKRSVWRSLAVLACALGVTATAGAAETLRLVTNWGKGVYSVARTLEWAEQFNASEAAKAAGIEVAHAGGPEVTPAREQLTAVRNGVFDMMFGAAGYYVGTVPEAFVFYGSDITPMAARENGGTALLNDIWEKKANTHVLGWVAAGVGYHVWLKEEPTLKDDGTLDLSGRKIRSSPLYRPWLDAMGATQVMVPAPDIYSALERGVVDGAAWPGLGITDLGFEKFIGYRVDPQVWQFDNLLLVNLDKWNTLTEAQQNALSGSVVEFETRAYDYYARLASEEKAKTDEVGVQSYMLSPDAAKLHVSRAQEIQWAQIREKAAENYDALREKFPPAE